MLIGALTLTAGFLVAVYGQAMGFTWGRTLIAALWLGLLIGIARTAPIATMGAIAVCIFWLGLETHGGENELRR